MIKMRRVRLTLLVGVFAVLGMFTSVAASTAKPANVSGGQSTDTAALVCADFFANSGHTANVDWYHCHSLGDANARRVHICGLSGTLHGITVINTTSGWIRRDHAHDPGGEGCG